MNQLETLLSSNNLSFEEFKKIVEEAVKDTAINLNVDLLNLSVTKKRGRLEIILTIKRRVVADDYVNIASNIVRQSLLKEKRNIGEIVETTLSLADMDNDFVKNVFYNISGKLKSLEQFNLSSGADQEYSGKILKASIEERNSNSDLVLVNKEIKNKILLKKESQLEIDRNKSLGDSLMVRIIGKLGEDLLAERFSKDAALLFLREALPEIVEGKIEVRRIARSSNFKTKAILENKTGKDYQPSLSSFLLSEKRSLFSSFHSQFGETLELCDWKENLKDLTLECFKNFDVEVKEVLEDSKQIKLRIKNEFKRDSIISAMIKDLRLNSRLLNFSIVIE